MRIISGIRRGYVLFSPKGKTVQPMQDRVRKALFDTLHDVAGTRVLDIFAGSGAVGLEALSEGASFCAFVEKVPANAFVIKRNIEKLAFQEISRLYTYDAYRVVELLKRQDDLLPYDLVFCDPPFADTRSVDKVSKVYNLIFNLAYDKIIRQKATVILRVKKGSFVEEDWVLYDIQDTRTYGNSTLIYLKAR